LSGVPIRQLLGFPFQRLSLESRLPVAKVLMRLQQAVEPRKLWRFSRLHRDFEGVVSLTGFKIIRIIHHRNSFLPVIMGKFQPRPQGGTRIEITMRLHWLVTAFMIVWAGVPTLILAAAVLHVHPGLGASVTARHVRRDLFVVAAMMLCFGYGLCSVCFNVEARRARKLLIKIVEAIG
jgi:hypothetical protein